LAPVNNTITLEILIDRSSVEIFGNGGQMVISNCFTPAEGDEDLVLSTQGGELKVINLDIYKLDSAWGN
ncbi:MAG: GH32 C-terminal domain-containing protein, partial [Prolixibacteraceae bacterium]|nr:GH32 C-terminal domain-containing protein [Prolixibacteraceae bacterium]